MLLPCPFCGEAEDFEIWEDWRPHEWVECNRCGCVGPKAPPDEAESAWNKRFAPHDKEMIE